MCTGTRHVVDRLLKLKSLSSFTDYSLTYCKPRGCDPSWIIPATTTSSSAWSRRREASRHKRNVLRKVLDLDLSRSRDVIGHATIRLAIYDFL